MSSPVSDRFAGSPSRNFGAGGWRGTRAQFPRPGRPRDDDQICAVARARLLQGLETATMQPVLLCLDPEQAGEIAGAEMTDLICAGLRGEAAPGALTTFLPINLGDAAAVEWLEHDALSAPGAHLFVVAGLLEWLGDPRPLLRMLRRRLKQHPQSRLALATYERGQHHGFPAPADLYRLWTQTELRSFVETIGFEVVESRTAGGVALTELRCSHAWHASFLARHGLPPQASRLVLRNAAPGNADVADVTTFIRQLERLDGQKPLELTVFGPRSEATQDSMRSEEFAYWDNPWLTPNGVLDAVLQVVFLYDGVQEILYADMGGVFCKVPQARRSGLLPPSILCVALCQGNSAFAEQRAGAFQHPDENLTHLWEKVAVELADVTLFPTPSMRHFYLDRLQLAPLGEEATRRLPYRLDPTPDAPAEFGLLDTVAVIGPWSGAPQWDEARGALERLAATELRLRRVVLLGRPLRAARPVLPPRVTLQELASDSDTDGLLRDLAPHGVALLLGGAGGHPYVVLETIDAGCPFLAADGSGAEALVPAGFREATLARLRATPLAAQLRRVFGQAPAERRSRAAELRQCAAADLEPVNAAWRSVRPWPRPSPTRPVPPDVSVVIPVFNRPFGEILDAVEGISNQIWPPREVIFVDDASDEDFATAHAATLDALLPMPARYIRHISNRGLSGARNTGLAACETQYVAMHDTDNVGANDFLYRGCLTLERNPSLDAVNFMASVFSDGEDWRKHDSGRKTYYPIGDGAVPSLGHINWFGDAMGVYRTQAARDLGGWDETSRAMWEDMAFYMALVTGGRRMMNVPSAEIFYRIRPDSMLRTESEFEARQRLIRSLRGLSVFDALCLQRTVLAQTHHSAVHALSPRQHIWAAVHIGLHDKPRLYRLARWLTRWLRRIKTAWASRRS